MNWLDFLEESVMNGLSLQYTRQKRGYQLFWTGKNSHTDEGVFEVRQGATGFGGDKKHFTYFADAYDWLLNGTPIKVAAQ